MQSLSNHPRIWNRLRGVTQLVLAVMLLVSCQQPTYYGGTFNEKAKINTRLMKNPNGGHYKVGVPYEVDGKWYYPKENENYDQVGIASWYGPNFHKKRTANGEIFDKHTLTAAHPTLPMPSMVWVENLKNGKKILVRVNDRGPFVKDREIDLSYAAAKALGFKDRGTAKVRVTFDKGATDALFYRDAPKKYAKQESKEWYVQLGAFGDRDAAERRERDYMKKYKTRIDRENGFYKVRVGPYGSRAEAEKVNKRLKSQTMEGFYVVSK